MSPPVRGRLSVPRRWPALPLVLAVAIAGFAGAPAIAVVGLLLLGVLAVTSPARAAATWPTDALAWLPVGAVAAFGALLLVIVPGGIVGLPVVTSGVTWLIAALLLGTAAWVRDGRITVWSPLSVLAWVPALAVGGALAYRLLQPMSYWSRPFWDLTDPMNHAWMVVETARVGRISYAAADLMGADGHVYYPRGLHAVLATVVAAGHPGPDMTAWWEPTLTVVMVALSAAAVLAIGATCLLAVQVTCRAGGGAWSSAIAVGVTGVLMLHPETFDVIFGDGFLTSAAAAVVLAALLLALDQRGRAAPAVRVIVALAAAGCTFYLWQVLALPVLALAAVLGVRWWRSGRPHPVGVVLSALVVLAICLPLARVTFGNAGVTQASAAAAVTPASSLITAVILALAAALVVATRLGRSRLGREGSVLVLAIVAAAVLVNLLSGGSWGDWSYYASKTIWHARTLALPAAVTAVVLAAPAAWRSARLRGLLPSGLVRGVVVGAVLIVGLAALGGRLADGLVSGVRGVADAGGITVQVPTLVLTDPAITAQSDRPVAPYLLHPQGWELWLRYDDWNAAVMLRAVGHPVPPAQALLARDAGAMCTWLAEHPDAVRVTGPRRGDQELLARGCPASTVRPDEWRVLVSPPEWWAGTPWADTGGAPDPSLEQPDLLLPPA